MKALSANWIAAFSVQSGLEPCFVVEIAFDDPPTDLHYFTSHDWAPLPTGATAYHGLFTDLPSVISQGLDSETSVSSIGKLQFTLQDSAYQVSKLAATKLASGTGLRLKRARLFVGARGLTWADMSTPFATALIDDIEQDGLTCAFEAADAQRLAGVIGFRVSKTTLTANISATALTVPLADTSGLIAVKHGSNYADAPDATVGYVRLEEELIRWTTKDASNVYCADVSGRGVLGSKAAAHEAGSSSDPNRKTLVQEWVYLQMPIVKVLRALLLGDLYGQSATLPAHWHAGVSSAYLDDAAFTGIGKDVWDTADDTKGPQAWIEGVANVNLKQFIEQELLLLAGLQLPIDGLGRFGLRRISGVLPGAATLLRIDHESIFSVTAVKHALRRVANLFEVRWAWHARLGQFLRTNQLRDDVSITRHKKTDMQRLAFKALAGGVHTENALNQTFNTRRSRFAGPPKEFEVEVPIIYGQLDPGDVIDVGLKHVVDLNTGTPLSGPYEVQKVSINFLTMRVRLSLFGSSEKAAPLALFSSATVLQDSAYETTGGTELSAYLAANYPGASNVTGDTLFITGTVTLPGNASMLAAGAIYYFLGPVQIQSTAVVNKTHNVQFWARGLITVYGADRGVGAGLQASLNGTAGARGYSAGGSGLDPRFDHADSQGVYYWRVVSKNNGRAQVGPNAGAEAPHLNLVNNGTSLLGLPADCRGTAGPRGGDSCNLALAETCVSSTDVGHGGAGMVFVCRGMQIAGSGYIDSSGLNGGGQTAIDVWGNGKLVWSGGSGPGCAGNVYILIDGSSVLIPTLNDSTIRSRDGVVANPAGATVNAYAEVWNGDDGQPFSVTGDPRTQIASVPGFATVAKVQFIPPQLVAEANPVDTINPVTGLDAFSGDAELLQQADGTVVSRVRLAWVLSVSTNVKGYRIRSRKQSAATFTTFSGLTTKDVSEYYFADVKDGETYVFEVQAVNVYGVESEWVSKTHTVVGKLAPPPPVSSFLTRAMPDGTRELTWSYPSPPLDHGGFSVRYKLGTGAVWADMTPLVGAELISPGLRATESNQLAAGTYTLAMVAVDTTGNESTARYIQVTLPDPRLAGVIAQVYPRLGGWAGIKTNCIVIETGDLIANETLDWSEAGAWEDAGTWAGTPYGTITYEHTAYDIGVVATFTPLITVVGTGTQTITVATSTDNITYTAFAAPALATARYIKVKVQMVVAAPTGTSFAIINDVTILLSAQTKNEIIEDKDTSTLTGSYRIAVGDIRLPITKSYAVIKGVNVALQNVAAGFSWVLIDKDKAVGPRIKIYNASNVLADCTIDAEVTGL